MRPDAVSIDSSAPARGFRRAASTWAALVALAFSGALFAAKFGPRAGIPAAASLCAWLAAFAIWAAIAARLSPLLPAGGRGRAWVWAGVAAYAALLLVVYLRVDPLGLDIDRWSALARFWEALARGEYPYGRTHLGSHISGFPMLFVAALPFWLLGDVGLLQFAALAAFAALALRVARGAGGAAFALLLLAALPLHAYEVVARSDLFSNMVLAAWLLHAGDRPGAFAGKRILIAAAAWGLLLSTRAVTVVPLALAAFPLLRGRPARDVILSGTVLAAVFLATLLPFYAWASERFRDVNPYFVQSGAIPGWAVAIVLAASLWTGFRHRAAPRLFAHAGLLLFAAVFAAWTIRSFEAGWANAIWNHGFDISYFCLPMPFLLLGLVRGRGEARPDVD